MSHLFIKNNSKVSLYKFCWKLTEDLLLLIKQFSYYCAQWYRSSIRNMKISLARGEFQYWRNIEQAQI